MDSKQLTAFDELRSSWLRHDELRRNGAPVKALWESREKLDAARRNAHRCNHRTAA